MDKINKLNFRIALTSAGLTQDQAAARFGVSQPLLSMVLSGKRSPSKRLTGMIQRFVNIEMRRLRIVPYTDIVPQKDAA